MVVQMVQNSIFKFVEIFIFSEFFPFSDSFIFRDTFIFRDIFILKYIFIFRTFLYSETFLYSKTFLYSESFLCSETFLYSVKSLYARKIFFKNGCFKNVKKLLSGTAMLESFWGTLAGLSESLFTAASGKRNSTVDVISGIFQNFRKARNTEGCSL